MNNERKNPECKKKLKVPSREEESIERRRTLTEKFSQTHITTITTCQQQNKKNLRCEEEEDDKKVLK